MAKKGKKKKSGKNVKTYFSKVGGMRPKAFKIWFSDQPISQKTKNLDAAKRPTNNHVPDLDCETGAK